MVAPGYRKRTIFLLLGFLLLRFWFGQTYELTSPEALLWLEGHGTNLSISYWDRGPLVPGLVRLGTLFFGDTELGVRWLAAVIACASGFILFYLARLWFNARAAFWTVVLFLVTPLYVWKLSFMSEATASVGLMALFLLTARGAVEEDRTLWWLLLGAVSGLSLLVALPNAWWIVGLLVYFSVTERRRGRLTEALLWSSIILASLFILPVLWWWNRPEVADVLHAHIWSTWPLSHPFSFNRGFQFLWLEFFNLGPLFALVMVAIFWRLGKQLWLDAHYALLFWLPVPGLIWQLFSSFFQEGRFDLIPALFFPWLLLCGCYLARLTRIFPQIRGLALALLIASGIEALLGLNPWVYLDGGFHFQPVPAGNNAASVQVNRRAVAWRALADQVLRLQTQEGAAAIMADSPGTASALSFYLPRHPAVYVVGLTDAITPFDFWPGYREGLSPGDSALFITTGNESPHADLVRSFDLVTRLTNTDPLPDSVVPWNYLSCQRFKDSAHAAGATEVPPVRDLEPLPK